MKSVKNIFCLFIVFSIGKSFQNEPGGESCPSPGDGSDGVNPSDCNDKISTEDTTKRVCCRAATAECLACASGTTVLEYCKRNPSTVGCTEEITSNDGVVDDDVATNDYYFDSYAHLGIHEEMIKDSVRTIAYRDAMLKNKHLFKGKVVLDVGCGTGILSMFAAQSGAKHVYCIDYSGIIKHTKKIIVANGFGDTITAIRSKVEELTLPVEQVDIIVSEWMGYCLFYESMLDSVLFARDKWLTKDGLMFPDKVTFHVAALEDLEYQNKKVNWWKNVYGFDMSTVGESWREDGIVDTCKKDQVVTASNRLRNINLQTFKKDEIPFEGKFNLKMKRDDYVNAIVAYFEIEFTYSHTYVGFSTSPYAPYTHWKQTYFFLEDFITARKDELISGVFRMKPNKRNVRDMDVEIDINFKGKMGEFVEKSKYIIR